MRTIERDDVERGPRGRRHGCCGGSGCRGGHGGGRRWDREDETRSRQRTLEERQRDLEQELAEVTGKLRDLRADRP
jgi:hypothetical protein